jgi:hypothetical protein
MGHRVTEMARPASRVPNRLHHSGAVGALPGNGRRQPNAPPALFGLAVLLAQPAASSLQAERARFAAASAADLISV